MSLHTQLSAPSSYRMQLRTKDITLGVQNLCHFTHNLKMAPPWILVISFLGFLSILKPITHLLIFVFSTLLQPTKDLKSYGSWAIVTGATDGIGKAFAHQLAKTGLHLILVSRDPNKLKKASSEIQTKFPTTRVKIVMFDFSHDVCSGLRSLKEAMEGIDVGILVNNVGITYPAASYFHEVGEEVWMRIVKVNLEGTTMVTRAVLGGMVERKRGAVVNIGSGAGIVVPAHPLYTIYAATKCYADQLSRCLYAEYKSFGIDVQCQVPLYVATKMVSKVASIEKSSLFIPSPDDYAEAAIKEIGQSPRCTPYWTHRLQWFFARLAPEPLLDAWRLSIGINRMKLAHSMA